MLRNRCPREFAQRHNREIRLLQRSFRPIRTFFPEVASTTLLEPLKSIFEAVLLHILARVAHAF